MSGQRLSDRPEPLGFSNLLELLRGVGVSKKAPCAPCIGGVGWGELNALNMF